MTTAIRIKNLSVAFAGRTVLDTLSLEVDSGGPTVLVGRSGSGKTTLLRALNRLNECLPDCATSGSVELRLGNEWLDAYAPGTSPEALRKRVGMVFQTPNPLPVSVARNMELPLELALGLGQQERAERAELALREAHLWDEVKDRLDHPARTLSGGQQQRLCLARALAFRPKILLLDEPTASLDHKSARGVEELLLDLAGRYTVLLVSHNLNQARRMSQRQSRRMFVLREGARLEAVAREDLDDKERLLALMDELL
ncbi:MAG: phosphate ABC transporter ATP-binding protein [Humidesulfovibrio sp.]|uniref:phosphate ABC transporter ATP-binding protein n=1 Tax=Humidesulfovibrio sp. TaxID=2910988 RepID=UPI0027F7F689|nr:phosphate ABC transporter ATP-binding protein [Humidesulfovibrio sp.]MDQ7836157.1 phosphate ABC transporter ATP-binding protein [Humidesulfovibrio sp.]